MNDTEILKLVKKFCRKSIKERASGSFYCSYILGEIENLQKEEKISIKERI